MDSLELYKSGLIWDDHCGFEMRPDAPIGALLDPWRRAGVDYLSINVYFDPQHWSMAIQNIAALRRRLPAEAPYCRVVSSVGEIDQARAQGQIAVTFDIEGMNALHGQLDLVQLYYDLGVRHMLFAYNRNNLAGSGCHDEDTGLTEFGCRVIGEMNRVGMVVDCSHTGVKTTLAAMECSSHPVVFSHSNARALVDHERNIGDDQIKACAQTGGVIGINGINLFLGESVAMPAAIARHAAYVAELTAPAHVGISLDYAPGLAVEEAGRESSGVAEMVAKNPEYWPVEAGYNASIGCLDICRLPEMVQALANVGFNPSEILGILGGNFRRIAEHVWK